MKLYEMFNDDNDPIQENGMYSPENDTLSKIDITDSRKPTLTLKDVNRLKKIRATKKLEMIKNTDLIGIMYGNGGEDSDIW